jgi:hypothetical protein
MTFLLLLTFFLVKDILEIGLEGRNKVNTGQTKAIKTSSNKKNLL